jgi:UDP-2-acetamido-2,6-beta-L-arabino-hexul-4-ose reductase
LNIVITGASGFIAKNLMASLNHVGQHQLFLIHKTSTNDELRQALLDADFLFHLAGVNRPNDFQEFYEGNVTFTKWITSTLLELKKTIPIVFTSSTQALLDNEYGQSKRQAEEELISYSKTTESSLFIYRLPGVFGKWSKPHYNSVVATFCYQIANDLTVEISDQSKQIELVYIDEVIEHFLSCMSKSNTSDYYQTIEDVSTISLGDLATKIQSFKNLKDKLTITDLTSKLDKQLFATFTSFIPMEQLRQPLNMNQTENSMFAEAMKSNSFGQVSLNTIESGAVRGNHWHHSKHEKFLVIQGEGIIRLRNLYSNDVFEIEVSGKRLEWIEILPGYVHNIENVGGNPLLTIMWASEIYDSSKPDTFSEDV